jgi:putative ABC transport system ATP-binding protein
MIGARPIRPTDTMLVLQGVCKRYPGAARAVLEKLDFTLAAGEYVAVMGESGVGKSTLLNLIAGLEPADTGSIIYGGQDVGALDDDAATLLRRREMGFVFQAFHVLPQLSVAENVALPLLLNGAEAREADARVAAMLTAVGLADRAGSRPRELSGGELQRVAIARALVHRPRLLLADEPTGNLDPDTAAQVLRLLREQLRASAAAGILVTHSLAAARTADRVFTLTPAGLVPLAPGGEVQEWPAGARR